MSKLSFTTLLQDTGLYYDRYLREVIEVLETDPHFREKLQTANTEDIKVSCVNCVHLCSCGSLHFHPQSFLVYVLHVTRASSIYMFISSWCPVSSVRTVVLVKSWTWSVTTSGLDSMNWNGRRFLASGCCWRLNWTAQIHRVSWLTLFQITEECVCSTCY